MSIYKKIKFAGSIALIILASIYLTFLIDTQTLNTWLKRIFIFCYFTAISCASFYFYNKIDKKHKYTLIPLLCAFSVVILGQNAFLPTKAEHTFYVQATAINEDADFKEAWLIDVVIDGENKNLSTLREVETSGWSYSEQYDDYFFAPSENNEENILSFTIVGENIVLKFGANTWSGSVRIFDGEGIDKTISLYNENTQIDVFEESLNIIREYSVFERILYNVGAILVFNFIFKALFLIILTLIDKKKIKSQKSAV